MKNLKGFHMRIAVEKEIGKKKFEMDLAIEALKHNGIQWDLFDSKRPIMKHEIAARSYRRKCNYRTALNLWLPRPTWPASPFTPGAQPTPADKDDVICFVVYDITFDELVRKIVQFHNLKAFL